MDIEGLIKEVRDHFLDQFRDFIRQERQSCSKGGPEVKLQLSQTSGIYRHLYCADFIRNDDQPNVIEFIPEYQLEFAPVTGKFGNIVIEIIAFRWDRVKITHTLPDLDHAHIDAWFDDWFDPDDRKYDQNSEFSHTIHSVTIEGQEICVDFGSAPVDAFWSLMGILEKSGAPQIKIIGDAS